MHLHAVVQAQRGVAALAAAAPRRKLPGSCRPPLPRLRRRTWLGAPVMLRSGRFPRLPCCRTIRCRLLSGSCRQLSSAAAANRMLPSLLRSAPDLAADVGVAVCWRPLRSCRGLPARARRACRLARVAWPGRVHCARPLDCCCALALSPLRFSCRRLQQSSTLGTDTAACMNSCSEQKVDPMVCMPDCKSLR